MRFLIVVFLFPFSVFAQESLIEIQYTDGTKWNGKNVSIFNEENGEKSFVILDSLDGTKKYVENIEFMKGTDDDGVQKVLEPVTYHGSMILSENSFSSKRVNIYDASDLFGDFTSSSGAWKNYHYTKDNSNMRHVDYTNLYEDLYENTESRKYLIKANRMRIIQNALYGLGGVLLAHAVFNTEYDPNKSKIVIPVSLYLSAASFIVPRFMQRSKRNNLVRALKVYK